MDGILILEDGTTFEGELFGREEETVGEVVFNTGMTGYQEVLTDPSYCGQIVTMTYPLVGNYGINPDDGESSRPQVRGFIVREQCRTPSHWRATASLSGYLSAQGITGLSGIDTRALTRHLRERGTMGGIIAPTGPGVDPAELAERASGWRPDDLLPLVSTPEPYTIDGDGPHVALLDYGVKANIIRSLQSYGCRITVLPHDVPAAAVLAIDPDGVLLSNGPGDPRAVGEEGLATVRALVGRIPLFGICLGHQILGLACGGETYKLKYGHRGANHPVRDLRSGRSYITSQNHGYALAADGLGALGLEVSHVNLNDGTVEGLRHRELPLFSVQYHPEACPGPGDSRYLFDQFLAMMRS